MKDPLDFTQAIEFFERKLAFTTGPVEVHSAMEKGSMPFTLIDVRAKKDFDLGHIPGAIDLPEDRWSEVGLLSRERINVIYCYSVVCHLAARAALQFGFETLALPEIISITAAINHRSMAVMTRLGMQRDHSADFLHRKLPVGDPLRPHVYYRLGAARWRTLNA